MVKETIKAQVAQDAKRPIVKRLVIPFGERVSVTKRYRRENTQWRRKEYKERDYEGKGIFLGWRIITNGQTECDSEDGCYWVVEKRFRAALVAISPNQNPIYIPENAIKV